MLVIGTQTGADIIAVNIATGSRKWITRADAHPDAQITGSAIIYRGIVYIGVSSSEEAAAANPNYKCCTFRGSLVALSESTGKVLWKTYTVPANGGKQGGYSGGAVWGSTPAVDQATDSVYVGTGNNYTIPAAATACVVSAMKNHSSDAKCTAPGDYFDSVLSLNLKTGKVNWGHKVEGYDAWTLACLNVPPGTGWCQSPAGQDYDFGAGPNLFTTRSAAGKAETLLGVGQKSGVYWAFNPATGRVAWDTFVAPRRHAVGHCHRRHPDLHGRRQQQPHPVHPARQRPGGRGDLQGRRMVRPQPGHRAHPVADLRSGGRA